MFKKTLWIVLVGCLLAPATFFGQSASDIRVPSGFRVEKVLETNKCQDPQGVAFLSNGDLVIASMMWRVYRVTPSGKVSTMASFKVNKEANPFDVIVVPGDIIYATEPNKWNGPGLYRIGNGTGVRVTPEDKDWLLYYITQDNDGNFYCTAKCPYPYFNGVVKISDPDNDGHFAVTELFSAPALQGIVFYDGHLYVLQTGDPVSDSKIWKYNTDGSTAELGDPVASNINDPMDLAVDSQGNFYTAAGRGGWPEGLGMYWNCDILKIGPENKHAVISSDFDGGGGLYVNVGPDDTVYISEFYRGVIFKITSSGSRVDVNRDYGISSASPILFDLDNHPYFSSFRKSRLMQLDPEAKSFTPVTPFLGICNQGGDVDDAGFFYISNLWAFPNWGNTIYKIDPVTGSVQKVSDIWTRTLAFDAYKRLVVTTNVAPSNVPPDERISTLGIVDLDTGGRTPYITGIHNIERGFLFDKDQNLYVKYKQDGIIKVPIPEIPTDPPFSVEGSPLFYDLSSKDSEIRFFDMNASGQLLIPLVDIGEIVLGDTDASVRDFASGFHWPGNVAFDRNGVLYVSDASNGIFRIIGEEFVVPAVNQRLRDLYTEIRAKVSNNGVANSLCQKIDNAIDSLVKGNIRAAENKLSALINEIIVQSGKKIAAADARKFIATVNSILDGLSLL
ncbi:MAG: hypothetical protein ABIL68_11945 [bacterium]